MNLPGHVTSHTTCVGGDITSSHTHHVCGRVTSHTYVRGRIQSQQCKRILAVKQDVVGGDSS